MALVSKRLIRSCIPVVWFYRMCQSVHCSQFYRMCQSVHCSQFYRMCQNVHCSQFYRMCQSVRCSQFYRMCQSIHCSQFYRMCLSVHCSQFYRMCQSIHCSQFTVTVSSLLNCFIGSVTPSALLLGRYKSSARVLHTNLPVATYVTVMSVLVKFSAIHFCLPRIKLKSQ
jgi:hypothetical protein